MRYIIHVYSILSRRGWHYSTKFNTFENVQLFLHCHKMQRFDDRLSHRLYRVHDNVDNIDKYYIVDYEKLSYKYNHVKLVTKDFAFDYILGV